jgi:adenosylcobinamide kinase/adenosylcobinamide-phosphate guanylyltransferase
MYEAELKGDEIGEDEMAIFARELVDACGRHPGTVIIVTNEIGMGIIPDNPLSRRYRDLVGRCNQVIASGADKVVLVTCGIPLVIMPT